MKSTVDEIRRRFDDDVERFSNLDTGQEATLDAPLVMEIVTEAAALIAPRASRVLDVGCGAGNYTLKLLQRLPKLGVTLVDLSKPMLDRAVQRISAAGVPGVEALQGDIREVELGVERFDIVMAAQCLHHLRGNDEWRDVFRRIHASVVAGGVFLVADSVEHELPGVERVMRRLWGEHLVRMKGESHRDHVFAYVEKEDTPRPLQWQLDLLREVGFAKVDVLHKHSRFAAFAAVK